MADNPNLPGGSGTEQEKRPTMVGMYDRPDRPVISPVLIILAVLVLIAVIALILFLFVL